MPIRGLFQNHADAWARSVEETARGERPLRLDGSISQLFPWVHLRKHTEAYLKKKGGSTSQNEKDARLGALIISYPQKDVAMAACAYSMAPSFLQALLHTELRRDFDIHSGQDGLFEYLCATWAASMCNPAYSQQEGTLAAALVPFATGSVPVVDQLPILLGLLSQSEYRDSVFASNIATMASSACLTFDHQLKQLCTGGHLRAASDRTSWMRTFVNVLPQSVNSAEIKELLDRDFSTWMSWAAWTPDQTRLRLWDAGFEQTHLDKLGHILSWEGPDLHPYPQINLKERILATACSEAAGDDTMVSVAGKVILTSPMPNAELREYMESVLTHMDSASRSISNDPYIGSVFDTLFANPLKDDQVDIFRLLIAANDPLVTRAAYEVLQPTPDPVHILASLPSYSEDSMVILSLRTRLGPLMMRALEKQLADLQANALKCFSSLSDGIPKHAEHDIRQLYQFGLFLSTISWSTIYLYPRISELLQKWPSLAQCESWMRLLQHSRSLSLSPAMQARLRTCFIHMFIQRPLNTEDDKLVRKLLQHLDQKQVDSRQGVLALFIVNNVDASTKLEYAIECLNHLDAASESLVKGLSDILIGSQQDDMEAIMALAEHLAMEIDTKAIMCWRVLLVRMIDGYGDKLTDDAMAYVGIRGFTQFIEDLGEIFVNNENRWQKVDEHVLLNKSLYDWVTKKIAPNEAALSEYAESVNGSGKAALHCMVISAGKPYAGQLSARIEEILGCLNSLSSRKSSAGDDDLGLRKKVIFKIINLLEQDGSNAHLVCFTTNALADRISKLSPIMLQTCEYILICLDNRDHKDIRSELCEVLIAGSIHPDDGLSPADRRALLQFGRLFNVQLSSQSSSSGNVTTDNRLRSVPQTMTPTLQNFSGSSNSVMLKPLKPLAQSYETVHEMLDEHMRELFKQAEHLESLRLAFKLQDPNDMSRLFEGLGFEDESPLRQMLKDLPPDLLDVIEQVNDREIEIQLPLTGLSTFQLTAMGHTLARNILVRLYFDTSRKKPFDGFCVHFDDDSDHDSHLSSSSSSTHKPHMIDAKTSSREITQCRGSLTPMIYQISRLLADHFAMGFTDLAVVHSLLEGLFNSRTVFSNCLVCNQPHKGTQSASATVAGPSRSTGNTVLSSISTSDTANIRFFRPSICHLASCKDVLFRSAPEVSLAILQQDPGAAVLILSAVYAVTLSTAKNQVFTLLPACPSPTADALKITLQNLVGLIPATFGLSSTARVDLKHYAIYGPGSETNAALIRWALAGSTYKGYLVSATGRLRLPGLPPGIQQFVQVHADPEQELAFATTLKMHRNESSVMFHGTTLDRLFAILVQGLKSQSRTEYQRNGSSYGQGIYLTDEMTTASGYSNTSAAGIVGVPWAGAGGRFGTAIRVMLGVELAGRSTPASTGIHVITDPARVIVRYVFVHGSSMSWPVARHVAPAMQSVFNSLRTGDI